jgi:PRTRC genetic system protein A
VEWIWAANGIFKRGISPTIEALICVSPTAPVPGLAPLAPYVRWPAASDRLPGQLLEFLLYDARRAAGGDRVATPIEKQYFFVERDGVRLVAPRDQDATASRVRYTMPVSGVPLLDIHSHHALRAYFSPTDDADDQGLSVSAVVGNIFRQAEIVVRINIYGHRQLVPALSIFDMLPDELSDRYGKRGLYATTRY